MEILQILFLFCAFYIQSGVTLELSEVDYFIDYELYSEEVESPSNVKIIANSSRALTVLWDAPEDDIDSYSVTWLPEDGRVEYSEDQTVAYLFDLDPCKTYSVNVTAIANGTESEPSEEQEQTTLIAAPPAVPSFSSPNQTLDSIALRWERPHTNCDVVYYRIEWTVIEPEQGNSDSNTTRLSIPGDHTEAVVGNLFSNYYYEFTIQAVNKAGSGPDASLSQYTDAGPDTLRNLTLTSDVHTIHASWHLYKPSGNVNAYKVSYTRYDGGALTCYTPANITSTQRAKNCTDAFESSPLRHCSEYEVKVEALDADDSSMSQINKAAFSLLDTTMQIYMHCEDSSSSSYSTLVDVKWNDIGNCLDVSISYTYKRLSDSYDYESGEMHSSNSYGFTIPGYPYTEYEFVMNASPVTKFNGISRCSCVTDEQSPSWPTNLEVSEYGETWARVRWDLPNEQNGLVRVYEVRWTQDLSDKYHYDYVSAADNYYPDYTILDLVPGESYAVSVRAKTVEYGPYEYVYFGTRASDNTWIVGVSVTVCLLAVVAALGFIYRESIGKRCRREVPEQENSQQQATL